MLSFEIELNVTRFCMFDDSGKPLKGVVGAELNIIRTAGKMQIIK